MRLKPTCSSPISLPSNTSTWTSRAPSCTRSMAWLSWRTGSEMLEAVSIDSASACMMTTPHSSRIEMASDCAENFTSEEIWVTHSSTIAMVGANVPMPQVIAILVPTPGVRVWSKVPSVSACAATGRRMRSPSM
ncbi:Uncharacterised protein [Mycobacteroides abscessus subsp. abscessus]|nr:Uncharacterised protein [Mycobacteroides abscessus subsp. abscessus]